MSEISLLAQLFQSTLPQGERQPELPPISSFLPFKTGFPASAFRALQVLIRHAGIDNNAVGKVVGRFIVDTVQTKTMGQYRCGQCLSFPPAVRLPSNNRSSCRVHSYFAAPGTRFLEELFRIGKFQFTLNRGTTRQRENRRSTPPAKHKYFFNGYCALGMLIRRTCQVSISLQPIQEFQVR